MDKVEKPDRIDTLEKHLAWAQQYCSWDSHDIRYYKSKEHQDIAPDWWWEHRENLRNEHTPRVVPFWAAQHRETQNLFIYMTPADPLKVGYTPSKEYGRADRQVVTTVGRLLTKLKFSEEFVRSIVAQHRARYLDNEVLFAFGADEIQHVYRYGPNSCMSHEESNWYYEYPVRIYDGPDTVLAYLKSGDSITARAICDISVAPMRIIRAYGDESLLKARLTKLGFVDSARYNEGARLRRAEAKDGWLVCPYVDYTCAAHDDGKFLVLGTGHIDPQTTGGTVPISGNYDEDSHDDDEWDYSCDHCDEGCNDTFTAYDSSGYECQICEYCHSESDSFVRAVVNASPRRVRAVHEEAVIELGGEYYLNNHELLNNLGFCYSESHDEWMHDSDCTYIESCGDYLPNEEVVTPLYRDDPENVDNCTKGATGDWIHDDDARETHDGRTFHERDTKEFEGRIYHIDEVVNPDLLDGRQGRLEIA